MGTVLCQKYRLDRLLGTGATAAVYAATHLRNANRVALKVLDVAIASEPVLRARFLREGYAANSVEHPGTVRVLDDDAAEDGSVFLVMDLLDGETLEQRWERSGRRLGAREVVHLMSEVLDVLVAAHDKGVVHRDLKPENLFVTRSGQVKVLDFGIARLHGAEGRALQLARPEAVIGTPAFMPPEQAVGRVGEVDALSDVWAVGATAFSLLAGRFVHDGENVEEMLARSATKPAPPLVSVAPEVPPLLGAVIDRALAFRRIDRWPSARAMRDALLETDEVLRTSEPRVQSAKVVGEDATESPMEIEVDDADDDDEEKTSLQVPVARVSGWPAAGDVPRGILSLTATTKPDRPRPRVATVSTTTIGRKGSVWMRWRSRPDWSAISAIALFLSVASLIVLAGAVAVGRRRAPLPVPPAEGATTTMPSASASTEPVEPREPP